MWYLGFIGYDQPIVEYCSQGKYGNSRWLTLKCSLFVHSSEHVNIFSENLTSLESEIRMSTNSHFSFICCCCCFFCWTNSLRGLRAWIKSLISIFEQWYAEKLSRFCRFIPKYSSLFSIEKVARRALFLELSGLESGKIVNPRSLTNASEWQKGKNFFFFFFFAWLY